MQCFGIDYRVKFKEVSIWQLSLALHGGTFALPPLQDGNLYLSSSVPLIRDPRRDISKALCQDTLAGRLGGVVMAGSQQRKCSLGTHLSSLSIRLRDGTTFSIRQTAGRRYEVAAIGPRLDQFSRAMVGASWLLEAHQYDSLGTVLRCLATLF